MAARTEPFEDPAADPLGPPGHGTHPPERPLHPIADADTAWLERAIVLGRRGWGRVQPNPMVGCVLVRDGAVLAEGWHREFGGPHAEVDALERAGAKAAGATAYVSLEPCRHHGKTPACTDALLRAGIARVVYAVADPHAEAGGGGDVLRAAGLAVDGPVWAEAVGRRENFTFFHATRSARPFVAVKLAVTLDGKIAARAGERTGITGPEANVATHRLRAGFDAVMVGGRTARIDDPRLTIRKGGLEPRVPPMRIVLDPDATVSTASALLKERAGRAAIFVGEDVDEDRIERLERAGAAVHPVRRSRRGLDLGAVLDVAAGLGVRSILCEGGGILVTSFLAERLAGRLYLLQAPHAVGPGGVPGFPGPFPAGTWEGWRPAFEPERLGADVLTIYEREG